MDSPGEALIIMAAAMAMGALIVFIEWWIFRG